MDQYLPPRPEKPDFEPKPAGSFLWWLIVACGGLMLLAVVAFLATPVLWVAFVIALIIALQYLLWGWWFERIYRSQPPKE
jgi:Flp pilus assembly protein TadB